MCEILANIAKQAKEESKCRMLTRLRQKCTKIWEKLIFTNFQNLLVVVLATALSRLKCFGDHRHSYDLIDCSNLDVGYKFCPCS